MAVFTRKRGDTIVLSIAVKDSAGAALNCAGGTLRATLKDELSDTDGTALAQINSPASGIVWILQTSGTATATFPASATSGLTADITLYYDVQYTDSAGRVDTVDSGTVQITRDVTQTTP